MAKEIIRCSWCGDDPLYQEYHDKEWGRPVHNDRKLFEYLMLEGAQAGLSWITVLRKRENYRKAFDNFDFNKVAKYNKRKIEALLKNEGIIRNRLKVNAFVKNAQAFIEIRREFGTFNKYIWAYVNNKPIVCKPTTMKDLPAKTELAEHISKDLKKRGFTFVGPTIVYAFMQAVGMVNDHVVDCFCYKELAKS